MSEKSQKVLECTHLPVYIGILRDLGIEERISGVSPEIDDMRYLEREKDFPIFKENFEKAQTQGHFSWLTLVEVEGELKLINKELVKDGQSESELKQEILQAEEFKKRSLVAGNIQVLVNSLVKKTYGDSSGNSIKQINKIIEDFEKTNSIEDIAEKLEELFSGKEYLKRSVVFSHDLSGRATGYDYTKREILLLSPKAHFKLREDIIDELEELKCDIYYNNTVQKINDYLVFEKNNKRLEKTLFELENLVTNLLFNEKEA